MHRNDDAVTGAGNVDRYQTAAGTLFHRVSFTALAVRFSNARCIRFRSHQTLTGLPKTWHELADVSLNSCQYIFNLIKVSGFDKVMIKACSKGALAV